MPDQPTPTPRAISAWKRAMIFVFNKIVWYEEEGSRQVGRVISKLPELMALVYLAEKIFKATVPSWMIIMIMPVLFGGLWTVGWLSRKYHVYEQERFADLRKDPIGTFHYTTLRMLRRWLKRQGEKEEKTI